MSNGIWNRSQPLVFALSSAVLCLDCEVVSNSRTQGCPACESRSLLNLAYIMGGSLRGPQSDHRATGGTFDIVATIELRQMCAKDLNPMLETLTKALDKSLAEGCVTFHVKVQPTSDKSLTEAA